MLFIDKDKFDDFRYIIGKFAFIRNNTNFRFIENENNKTMLMVNQEGEKCHISMFSVDDSIKDDYKQYVFYSAANKDIGEKETVIKMSMSSETIQENNMFFKMALFNPDILREQINDPRFDEWTKDILFTGKELIKQYKDIIGYKYRCKDTIDNNRYRVCDGFISFLPPFFMNDPFDCNCVFQNNSDMSNYFKLFCIAPSWKNILMWSYYAESHEGYCFGYRLEDIINELLKNGPVNGLVLFGKTKYSTKRPYYHTKSNTFSYTQMSKYITAAFTKFIDWKHEDEMRFVILSEPDKLSDNEKTSLSERDIAIKNIINLQVPIESAYVGCKNNGEWKNSTGLKNAGISPLEVKKHDSEYELKC